MLVVVFFYHWIGFWLTFRYRQYQIKESMWENIASNSQFYTRFTLIKLSLQEQQKNPHFRWEEQGREFVYNNQWYDVVKMVIKHDTTYFYCEHDIDEEIFVNSLKNNQQKELETKKTNLHKPLLIEGYFPESIYHTVYLFESQVFLPPFVLTSYYQIFTDIPSPPPQFS